jgi:hypothetical protein
VKERKAVVGDYLVELVPRLRAALRDRTAARSD